MSEAHTVEVDRAAEIEALAAISESEAAAAPGPEQPAPELDAPVGSDPAAWLKATDFVVELVAGQVCPAWDLDEPERRDLSGALAEVLDHYFPGGPNGIDNWHPLYKLVAVAGFVAIKRFDGATLRLRPMYVQPEKPNGESEAPGRESPVPGRPDAVGEERKRFTLGSQ